MPNFDLSALALKSVCPNNEILYDDKGLPSVMVRIPKQTYASLGISESTQTHPAFIVNGQEIDEIYIGKYQSVVHEGRAYSLPGVLNTSYIDLETALKRCSDKGSGWHCMTFVEQRMLMLLCEKRGFIPIGNNNWGKHSTESNYIALPGDYEDGKIRRTLTGTGPLTWYHDNSPSGIADLCGNVWEWAGGIRTVYGELQVLINNNAADSSKSQLVSSGEWKAINARTGEFITPNGSGTTANSIKMNWANSKLTYDTSATPTGDGTKPGRSCTFANITHNSTNVLANGVNVLKALGLYPLSTSVLCASQYVYWNPYEEEQSFFLSCGYRSTDYGIGSFNGNHARTHSDVTVGFRLAYCKLPAA